ncbi:hypothetical protein KP509_01G073600 [Ceratopteris richardii]|uniref:Chromo domain-containing protein n=1 Tax=Ceratopteris richardii TaxID=49495 RepID=A0A8T2VMG5_CERRI|nr:hypothetical protein KP509_01G073600 [Ceratopteris richardii]
MDIKLSNHVKNPNVGDKAQYRMDIHKELKEEICKAQEQYKPCAKLDHQRFGSFTILAKINLVTFKLQLPSTMRIHPLLHVSMGVRTSPVPPIEIDDHAEFEVEHVLDSRISQERLEYFTHCKGYDISDRTWERTETLQRALVKVQEFHKRNPKKPRP